MGDQELHDLWNRFNLQNFEKINRGEEGAVHRGAGWLMSNLFFIVRCWRDMICNCLDQRVMEALIKFCSTTSISSRAEAHADLIAFRND
jgi:hypothetical protein